MSIILNGTTGITSTGITETSDGNVGINTSSPAEKLSVSGRVFVSGSGYITNPTGLVLGQYASNDVYIQKPSGANLSFWDSATNAQVTIDSSGNLLVGTTSSPFAKVLIKQAASDPYARLIRLETVNAGTIEAIQFVKNSGGLAQVGSITMTTTATAYNTSSDYRLKEDWVAVADASTRVNALKPVNFAWKVDGSRVDGFLAHEVQAVVPEAVTGTKDAMRDEEYEVTPAVLDDEGAVVTPAVMGTRSVPDYQGIDQSKLVPLLTAALQEALAKIEDLTARVSALEASNV